MGEEEPAGLYLVFELINGPTLRERLHTHGPLAPAEVALLARSLGSALTNAHTAGVLHRNIKPENVMLPATGPKLADFGIAVDPLSIAASPAYAAPEVLGSGTFSPQSDAFSLAATLYEALTGQKAFPGDDGLSVATQVAMAKHAAPTTVLPGLLTVLYAYRCSLRSGAREGGAQPLCNLRGLRPSARCGARGSDHRLLVDPRVTLVDRAASHAQMAKYGSAIRCRGHPCPHRHRAVAFRCTRSGGLAARCRQRLRCRGR